MSKLRMQNAINEYKSCIHKTTRGAFYYSDVQELMDITLAERPQWRKEVSGLCFDDVLSLTVNALNGAFMIGYRCAKNEQRKRKQKKTQKA